MFYLLEFWKLAVAQVTKAPMNTGRHPDNGGLDMNEKRGLLYRKSRYLLIWFRFHSTSRWTTTTVLVPVLRNNQFIISQDACS